MIVEVKKVLRDALVLGDEVDRLEPTSPLLGALRELDSVGVMSVINALEERFDIEVDDAEIAPEVFETVGSLAAFLESKLEE